MSSEVSDKKKIEMDSMPVEAYLLIHIMHAVTYQFSDDHRLKPEPFHTPIEIWNKVRTYTRLNNISQDKVCEGCEELFHNSLLEKMLDENSNDVSYRITN